MKKSSGFTLIELLVVMVIIGLLVSMASINTNHDKRADVLNSEAKRLKFFLEAVSDEAMFQNQNIGFEVSRFTMTPYAWLPKEAGSASTLSSPDETHSWQNYTGRFIKTYDLPEEMEFELSIEGSEVILPFSPNTKIEDVAPQFYALANGQQSIASFQITINDFNALAKVKGFGVGRFYDLVEISDE